MLCCPPPFGAVRRGGDGDDAEDLELQELSAQVDHLHDDLE